MPPPEDAPPPDPQPNPRGSGGGAPGRAGGSRSEPAVIALQMEDLTLWVIERVAKFPRDHKFTLGDRLVETCLDITTDLVEATYLSARGPHELARLHRAARSLTRARILVRMAQRLALLSSNQREHFAQRSDDIGRMLGGWTRHLQPR